MKLIVLVITGICAIVAQTSSIGNVNNELQLPLSHEFDLAARSGLLEKVRELIKTIIERVRKAIENVISQGQAIIANIKERIQNIIDESKIIIENIISEVLAKLEETAIQGELARECVETHRPILNEILKEYISTIKNCSQYAIQQAESISAIIEKHVHAIQANIDALQDVVSECLESTSTPLQLVRCVAKEAEQIKDEILDIFQNAKTAVTDGTRRAVEIVQNGEKCIIDASLETKQKINSTVEDVKKCIIDGGL